MKNQVSYQIYDFNIIFFNIENPWKTLGFFDVLKNIWYHGSRIYIINTSMAFWNKETLPDSTKDKIHIRSIADLKNQDIDTEGMWLEWKTINIKTTQQQLEQLKNTLSSQTTVEEKAEILQQFLNLEKQNVSRNATVDVQALSKNMESERVSETEEKKAEEQLLAAAETAAEAVTEKSAEKVEEVLVGAATETMSKPIVAATAWFASIPFIWKWFEKSNITGGINNWFEKAFTEDGIFWFIWKFFKSISAKVASIFSFWNKDTPWEEVDDETKKPAEETKTWNPETETVENNEWKYTAINTVLTRLSPEEAQKEWVGRILSNPSLKEMKFGELKGFIGKSHSFHKLAERLNISSPDSKPHALYFLLSLAGSKQKREQNNTWWEDTENKEEVWKVSYIHTILTEEFSKKHPDRDINEATFEEVVLSMGTSLNRFLSFKDIDLRDFLTSSQEISQDLLSYNAETQEFWWQLSEEAKTLWVNQEILKRLFVINPSETFSQERMNDYAKQSTWEDQETLKNIAEFWKKYIENFSNNPQFNLWNTEAANITLNEGNIDNSLMLKIYLLLWWKTNIDEMNSAQQLGVVMSALLMTSTSPEASGNTLWSFFTASNVKNWFHEWGNKIEDVIPQWVQDFVSETFSFDAVWDAVKKETWDTLTFSKAFVKESPWLSSVFILVALLLPIFARRTSVAWILTGRR